MPPSAIRDSCESPPEFLPKRRLLKISSHHFFGSALDKHLPETVHLTPVVRVASSQSHNQVWCCAKTMGPAKREDASRSRAAELPALLFRHNAGFPPCIFTRCRTGPEPASAGRAA